jgi:phenylacetate-CoA ligase
MVSFERLPIESSQVASLTDRIYLHSPKPVQHLLVSLKGLQLERQRRQGQYHEFLSEIRQRNHFSRAEFADYQLQRLRSVLQLAERSVPYYQESFARSGVKAANLVSLPDLARFPLLPKDQVRARSAEMVPTDLDRRRLLRLNTTGTTGSPMTIYSAHRARQENYAHFDNFLELAGIDPRARRAVFGGRILQPGDDRRPPFWRRNLFQNAWLFSSYHMLEETLPLYLEALRSFRPEILEGYPSSLYRLASYLLAKGTTFPVRGVITSSETLLDQQREAMERAFGCQITDQYGAAEMCVFAGQCARGRYHIRSDYGIVEILQDGEPAAPGEDGEVVCTGFINAAMPLIRYQIGDIARWARDVCDCGIDTPLLETITGRQDDVVVTPEGSRVGRLSPVLKGFPVREAQYIQDAAGRLTVLLVPDDGFSDAMFGPLEAELRKRVGPTIPLSFRVVEAIPRGPGGKFRAVISSYRS